MNELGLSQSEEELIRGALRGHAEILEARIFGSRAKGTHKPYSDVDIAIWGEVDNSTLGAIAEALDELPLPYRFDVVVYDRIAHEPLREHIDRVGVRFYRKAGAAVPAE